jgi:hypothetical protein
MFMRTLGASVGVAAFGSLFASRIGDALRARVPAEAIPPGDITSLLREPAAIDALPAVVADAVREAAAVSLQPVFVGGAVAAATGLLLATRLREPPLRRRVVADGPEEEVVEAVAH